MRARGRLSAAIAGASVLAVSAGAGASLAGASGDERNPARFVTQLNGYEEVPSISTSATGRFRARVTDSGLAWRLRYEGIEGGPVQQAHIHLAQPGVNGGVSAFLCSNLPSAPAGVQPCPPPPAALSGTISAEQVIGPAAQGIAPGELEELLRAMAAGVTYANVHSQAFPGGEIRGQIGHC